LTTFCEPTPLTIRSHPRLIYIYSSEGPDTLSGYDAVILSDLLHFHTSHSVLLRSLSALLARKLEARVYVGAGKYTPTHVCDSWLRLSSDSGFLWEEIHLGDDQHWQGALKVVWEGEVLDEEALALRKGNCRLWVGRWSTTTVTDS
jgi:EEF1A N-terminal glycine/lysine methyltransferase